MIQRLSLVVFVLLLQFRCLNARSQNAATQQRPTIFPRAEYWLSQEKLSA
jgi:hypothetical protein